jgi:hypothetical protein
MKQLLTILFSLFGLTSLNAENYPYRSDYLWVTVPDHADWIYQVGEQASVEVQFYKYGVPRNGEVEYAIGNDLMEADVKGVVKLKNGRAPALSDMAAAAEDGRTHGYPHFSKKEGFLTQQHLKTLPYFDVCCFAPYIKAKTYLTWGFNDNTCPPTTSYAVWNLLKCEKESLITPINEHWTSDATDRQQLQWILDNIDGSAQAE